MSWIEDKQKKEFLGNHTLYQFLNEDLNKVIEAFPDGAATFKSLMIHVTDHKRSKGISRVSFSEIRCNASGYCTGDINYG